jgi:antitoxin component HigA of HigAB toxin-antitoxin module
MLVCGAADRAGGKSVSLGHFKNRNPLRLNPLRSHGVEDELDRRHDELTPEEREYSELLTVLNEAFEEANYALEGSTPDSRLRSLMEEHGLRQRDMLEILGSRGIASR